ncbi:hypothetical protein CYMTET_12678 [Cymbomonas tetramitiformis]|uniref:Uncharacterized protein n=1 Tax=Cymbomonas tetramitiformis TaxID=36881 RepID=A0AAE0LBU0_9CHLO|nr:hypothetical protein CYMTET_12678 [Cymbomonas tetramitiformis]
MSSRISQQPGCGKEMRKVARTHVICPQGELRVVRRSSMNRKGHCQGPGAGVGGLRLANDRRGGARRSLAIFSPPGERPRRVHNKKRLVVQSSSFDQLGLNPSLTRAVEAELWLKPTEIQRRAIPALLDGADVWAEAPTGSGKTAAFALPLLQRLMEAEPRRPGRFAAAVVLSPTRELAVQTSGVIRSLLTYTHADTAATGPNLRSSVLHGGVSINPQLRDLTRGVDVLVATPGRLLDVVEQNGISLAETRMLVLDEADKLLNPAFAAELDAVLELLPGDFNLNTALGSDDDVDDSGAEDGLIQACLFSATFPYKTRAAAARLFRGRSPLRISPSLPDRRDGGGGGASEPVPVAGTTAVDKYKVGAVVETITERVIRVDARDRTSLLAHLAKEEGWDRILCFVGSQYRTEHVTQKLWKRGITAAALHGGLTQEVRAARLAGFNTTGANPARVLVATDVAARGLDVKGLPTVVNYDLPRSTAEYTHRVGRTGRAGMQGVAVSFVTANDVGHFELIEKRHGGDKLEREVVAGFEPKDYASPMRAATPAGGGADGALDVVGVVQGVTHSKLGLAHDRMHGGVKGKRKSKKDKLREAAVASAAAAAAGDDEGE